ncbi:dephospho-CoA kinase [Lentilactobacillus senioris]|uniref:dephospho-CoA kinase n=1 Tax=Lentilactobacillus senioris TaxID=931534 RepID=UPI00227F87F7|nr:dephospho-CoA kinase [Lentilactobacillus senioris]MCY9806962.1 dephospho-CoA kinase [Lentilactobacillus senioris]
MMSKIIGLTGGIATGKSLVSSFLSQQAIPIIDADQITKRVEAKDTVGLAAIVAEFGKDMLQSDGQLNRKALGRIVFSDKEQLKLLVRTIDPFIRQQIVKEVQELKEHSLIVLDAPTLFENGYQQLVDEILMVSCTANIQLQRLMQRNNLSIVQANQRIQAQWPVEVKQQLADYVIYNSETKQKTYQQVADWLTQQ